MAPKCILLLLAAALASPAARQIPAQQEKAALEGTVIDAQTRQPLRKAHVFLSQILDKRDNQQQPYGTVTDDTGRFSFDDLDPGKYRLDAQKIGYLGYPSRGGYARSSDKSALNLQLSAGQKLRAIQLELTPQGVIAGRVIDADGDLCENCTASIFTYARRNGKRQAAFLDNTELNDRAEFRFTGLAAGRYYLCARPDDSAFQRPGPGKKPPPEGPVLTYYPSSFDLESATPIALTAGQQLSDLEIRLQRAEVHSVKGKVTGLENAPKLNDFGPRQLHIWARRKDSTDELGFSASTFAAKDGSFELTGLTPGAYEIVVSGTAIVARTPVEIAAADVSGVTLQIPPLQSITGKIRLDGGQTIDFAGIWLRLEDENGGYMRPARVKEDGSFTLSDLRADKYRLRLWNLPKSTYFKALYIGQTEVAEPALDLSTASPGSIQVVLSSDAAKIQGDVKTDAPATAATDSQAISPRTWQVVLAPASADAAIQELRVKTAAVDQNGAFTLDGIAPGLYHLYAFEKIDSDLSTDPDFLQQMAGSAAEISLKPNDAQQVHLSLIPAENIEQVKSRLGIQ